MCTLEDFAHLKLDTYHSQVLKNELVKWHVYYLPRNGKLPDPVLKGTAAVLDIGAGNGETCQFYLNHGARRVICIEPMSNLLVENFGSDGRVTILPDYVGFIKSDCEGGERDMVVEGGHGVPSRWHVVQRENPSIYNRLWRFDEDWGPLYKKALRKLGRLLVDIG